MFPLGLAGASVAAPCSSTGGVSVLPRIMMMSAATKLPRMAMNPSAIIQVMW